VIARSRQQNTWSVRYLPSFSVLRGALSRGRGARLRRPESVAVLQSVKAVAFRRSRSNVGRASAAQDRQGSSRRRSRRARRDADELADKKPALAAK